MECRVTRDCVSKLHPGGPSRYRVEGSLVNWGGTLDDMPRWYEPLSGPMPKRDPSLPVPPLGRQGVVPPSTDPKKRAAAEARKTAATAEPDQSDVRPLSSLNPDAGVQAALAQMDPENDSQWTALGLVRLEALEAVMGREVSRGDVRQADPGFDRDAARAARR